MVNTCAALFVSAILVVPAAAPAEDAKSPELVKQLTQMLDQKKLEAIAGADSKNLGTYVAALYFPGTQLLVVSGKYSAPPLLNEKIAKKDFRDVYIDLNSASVAGSKIFVMDQACDGLVARPGDSQAADTWEHGPKTTAFDGDWKKAKMSEDEYQKAFTAADEQYARILTLLADQAKKAGS